jgi:hypothetical protein
MKKVYTPKTFSMFKILLIGLLITSSLSKQRGKTYDDLADLIKGTNDKITDE